LQQQALTLWSRKAPKLAALQQASSGAGQASEVAAATQQAPEPDKLRSRTSSGTGQASEFVVLQQQAFTLRRLQQACCVAGASSHAPEKLQSLELACLFKQNKQK